LPSLCPTKILYAFIPKRATWLSISSSLIVSSQKYLQTSK
jgi:hypothetical protein